MGFPRIIEVKIRTKAQPKTGDVAIKKSKRYGNFRPVVLYTTIFKLKNIKLFYGSAG